MDKKINTEKKPKTENKNVASLSQEELQKDLAKKRRALLELRFQKAGQQLSNFKKLGQERREIARILTALNKKETK